jgi:hypothetical protein
VQTRTASGDPAADRLVVLARVRHARCESITPPPPRARRRLLLRHRQYLADDRLIHPLATQRVRDLAHHRDDLLLQAWRREIPRQQPHLKSPG